MKQFFALAVSCLSVAAFAQPQVNAVSAPAHANFGATVKHFDVNTPAHMMQVCGRTNRVMTLDGQRSMQDPVTSSAAGALYLPSSHSLKAGLFYYEAANAWGYTYNTPMLFSQAYQGTYDKVVGANWTIGTNDTAVDEEKLNADGNYDMGLAGMGVGGFYTPKIWSKRGSASFFYGSDDDSAPEYSVNYKGDAEALTLGVYQVYGDMNLYRGYSNTLAYGARDFESAKGSHITSDRVLLDVGNVGGGFVLQKLELPLRTHEDDAEYFENDNVVTITVIDYNEETGETKEYTSTFGKDDIFYDGNGMGIAMPTFTTVDEDGFETEIEPVLNNYVQIVMSGFRQEGVNCGFLMVWDNTADDDSRSGGDFGSTHSYYDQWVDGVQDLTEDGSVAYYATDCTEAVIGLVGYFNALCEYGTGAKVMNGTAPAEGGYVVSAVQEGQEYNDFDVESSFTFENIEITDAPEWITKVEYNDEYFEDYSVIAYYLTAEALPEGVSGREGDVVLTSNGEVSITLHVTQGEASGIDTVKVHAKDVKTFNLQGQKNETESGLMVKGNKVVFVKK